MCGKTEWRDARCGRSVQKVVGGSDNEKMLYWNRYGCMWLTSARVELNIHTLHLSVHYYIHRKVKCESLDVLLDELKDRKETERLEWNGYRCRTLGRG